MDDASKPNVNIEPTPFGLRLSNEHGSMLLSIVEGSAVLHDLVGDGKQGSLITEFGACVESLLKQEGFDSVLIHVDAKNERLIDVYKNRWDFEPVALVMKKSF